MICEELYLAKDIADIFDAYGGVEVCVNRILDEASQGKFDLMNKPAITHKDQCRRYTIAIRNQDYIDLRQIYPANSAKISLRRLCEWYVSNEMYIEWEPVKAFNPPLSKYKKSIIYSITAATELQRTSNNKNAKEINEILNLLKQIYTENFINERR